MRRRGADALLAGALVRSARAAGCAVTVAAQRHRSWASATFAGTRHAVTLTAPASQATTDWLATLPEAELAVCGHIVADVAVDAVRDDAAGMRITLTALMVAADWD